MNRLESFPYLETRHFINEWWVFVVVLFMDQKIFFFLIFSCEWYHLMCATHIPESSEINKISGNLSFIEFFNYKIGFIFGWWTEFENSDFKVTMKTVQYWAYVQILSLRLTAYIFKIVHYSFLVLSAIPKLSWQYLHRSSLS